MLISRMAEFVDNGSILIVQTYPQGRSIRAYILSTMREIFSANASPLQKPDALVNNSVQILISSMD